MIKARSAKAKGTRLEKRVTADLKRLGLTLVRRQPGSGIFDGFPHDNYFVIPGVGPFLAECKSWKHGWRTGDKAMGKADILIIKRDAVNQHDEFTEPKVYMPWRTFAALISALVEKGEDLS